MIHRLKICWKILTRDDWYLIAKNPPKHPWTLYVGDIEVKYK